MARRTVANSRQGLTQRTEVMAAIQLSKLLDDDRPGLLHG